MKIIKWFDDHLEEVVMMMILAIMLAVLTAQIIFRKLLGNSLAWSEELCRYLFIWSGFLSLSYTIHYHSAMKTDLFLNMFPKKLQKIIAVLTDIFLIALFAILFSVAVQIVPTITQMGTAIPISRKYIFAAAAVGFGLTVIRLLQELVNDIRNLGKGEK